MPQDLTALWLLLIFIAPGFLFARAYWRDWPRYYRDPDLFQQTVSAIIASTAVHFLLLVSVAFIAVAWPDFGDWALSLLNQLLQASPTSPLSLKLPDLVGLTLYPILSLGSGWFSGVGLRRRLPPPLLTWLANLVAEAKARQRATRLRVRLRNGEQYVGTLASFVWVGSKETTYELALTATWREDPDNPPPSPIRLPGQTILFLSSDILWLSKIK